MTYTLIYDFENNYDYFEYPVEQDVEDILKYEFEKFFKHAYSPFFLTETQKEFIRDFEDKCIHNQIHYYEYYTTHNFDFLDWLKDKYYYEAEEAKESELDEDDYDDWWYCLSEEDKKDIYNEYN